MNVVEKHRRIRPADDVKFLPVTEDSHPLGASLHQVVPIDLSKFGYVEEEYEISGKATVYTWPQNSKYVVPELENAPYTTRFLIRKPVDPDKFSGNVIVEMFNWARGYDRTIDAWGHCWQYLIDNGDAWVGVTCRGEVIENLKRFDPERYKDLSYRNPRPESSWNDRPQSNTYHDNVTDPSTENGLTFDMYSQLGILLREEEARNPLYGYNVKKIIGTSALPGDISTYVAGIDPICEDWKGAPIYDGFLIFMTGAPGNVNQYEDKMHYLDERCKFYGKVPLIRVYTAKDMLGTGHHPDWAYMQRHPDSDISGHYYRSYEVAGTALSIKYNHFAEPCREDLAKMGIVAKNLRTGKAFKEHDTRHYEFPIRYPLAAAFDNLKKWIDGINPPKTLPFETIYEYPDTKLRVDEFGNTMGGLRTPYVDVPAYHFRPDAVADPLEIDILKGLYKDHDDYVEKVVNSTLDCVKKRLILPDDAKRIIQEAIESDVLR